MDNAQLYNKPVSELTSAEKDAMVGPNPPKTRYGRINWAHVLIVGGICLGLIGVGVGISFFIRPAANTVRDPETEPQDLGEFWAPTEDTSSVNQEVVDYYQSVLNNPESTSDEKLVAQTQLADIETRMEEFAAAEERLNLIDREGLTDRQLYYLYSAYAYLYDHSDNQEKFDEYSTLLEEVANRPWEES